MTGDMGVADQIEQTGVFPRAIGNGLPKAFMGDAQHPTHQRDGVFCPMFDHEAGLHLGSLAKYRAAFFGRSRSSSTRPAPGPEIEGSSSSRRAVPSIAAQIDPEKPNLHGDFRRIRTTSGSQYAVWNPMRTFIAEARVGPLSAS